MENTLHGGDVVLLKHSESGGYITLDELSEDKENMLECYVRVSKSQTNELEITTANQLFELEKDTDTIEDSGTALEW